MSKLPTKVDTKLPISAIPFPATSPVVLVFNKVRDCDGEIKETGILSHSIMGMEKTKVAYKGKFYDGTKIYTTEGSFKVLHTLEAFSEGCAMALHSGQAVKLTGKAPLLLGKGK